MRNWAISAGNKGWGIKLDVRDLGGHLDMTNRARAGTLARRAIHATSQVCMVGALPFGFLRSVGFARAKFLPAGLHGAEGSHNSLKNLNSFRTGIVNACWPKKLPMANPQAVLSLLDAPDCCDPELYVIWSRFRQMRRFLAYRPEEVRRVYRLLDLAAAGRPGHGPVHLLLHSASQLGFAWDSQEEGWLRPGLPPLRMLAGPYQHFRNAIFLHGGAVLRVFLLLVRVFGEDHFLIMKVPSSFFSLPTCGNGIRCYSVVSCVRGLGTDSYLEKPKRRMFLAVSVVGLMEMVIFSGIALPPPSPY